MADLPNLRDDSFWDGPGEDDENESQAPTPTAVRRGAKRGTAPRGSRVETRGRVRALQALYAADMRDYTRLRRVAIQVWDDLSIAPDERRIASALVEVILVRGAEVDGALTEVTANWRLERLGAIERSVLRLATAELLVGETPPKVAIQEAVRLAERFGSSRSARFVNGVLDAVARHMGRL